MDPSGFVRVRKLRLRAFNGTRSSYSPARADYPRENEIYLDSEARAQLGFGYRAGEYFDYPIAVEVSIGSLLTERALTYGLTLFLGSTTITTLAITLEPKLSSVAQLGLTFGSATVLTAILAVLDLRARIHY